MLAVLPVCGVVSNAVMVHSWQSDLVSRVRLLAVSGPDHSFGEGQMIQF